MPELIAYASRTGTRRNLAGLSAAKWRLLVSARGVLRTEGFPYALDNGAWTAFQAGEAFDEAAFVRALTKLGKNADWTVIPDVVAGGKASLDLSLKWMRRVLDECRVGLLAVQDGMEASDVEHLIGERVGIFIGGSTEWKLRTMPIWGGLANRKGAWCHVGRVNSQKRIRLCGFAGAKSFDGSSASRYAVGLAKLDAGVRQQFFDLTHPLPEKKC